MSRARTAVLALLVVALVAYPLLPVTVEDRYAVYGVLVVASLLTALSGLRRHRPRPALPWLLVVAGYVTWTAADGLSVTVWDSGVFPTPADHLYLAAYAALGVGMVRLTPGRAAAGDTAVLDSLIVTVGVAVPAATFLIAPISRDADLSVLARVMASAYPVADLFLLAVLARRVLRSGSASPALRLLTASVGMTFLADCVHNVVMLRFPDLVGAAWMGMVWLSAYVLLAAACSHPALATVAPPAQRTSGRAAPTLYVLAAGSMLPGATLLADGWADGRVAWAPLGVGAVALSGLVLARMAVLLRRLEAQAAELAAVARMDGLTGAPNRRTWDVELERACATAARTGVPLAVAIVDLDHFKQFNDRHGHQAGDELLRACVRAWTQRLGPGRLLARYGGEEFALLLPGLEPEAAGVVVDGLRACTPHGTFSAGVAAPWPGASPQDVVAAADRALYRAKRSGRDRVELAADHELAGDHPVGPDVADDARAVADRAHAPTLPRQRRAAAREGRRSEAR